ETLFTLQESGALASQGRIVVFVKSNGLSIALMLFFVITQIGMSWVGYTQENNERLQHGRTAIDYPAYLMSDSFLEATMENWESEFLQMFAYVIFTVFFSRKALRNQNQCRT